jgi:hypothetical protein
MESTLSAAGDAIAGSSSSVASWRSAVSWTAQVLVAAILLQTLYFKLTYAPETQYIFGKLGGRPAATIAALVELVCAALLLHSSAAGVGALLSLGVMGGAILGHLFVFGVAILDAETGKSDGGLLFGLAILVAAGAVVVLMFRWRQIPFAEQWIAALGIGRHS